MRKALIALTTLLAIGLGTAVVAQAQSPQPVDATLTLKEGSVAAGIGFSWGSGTLSYKGQDYPVSVEGLTVGTVGIAEATASGKVYNLKQLKDFDGIYTAAKAGLTVAGGGSVTVMRNQNGVGIDLISTTEGAKITLGDAGVKLKIKQ